MQGCLQNNGKIRMPDLINKILELEKEILEIQDEAKRQNLQGQIDELKNEYQKEIERLQGLVEISKKMSEADSGLELKVKNGALKGKAESERISALLEGPVKFFIEGDSIYSLADGEKKRIVHGCEDIGWLTLSPDKKRLAFHATNILPQYKICKTQDPIPYISFSLDPEIRRVYAVNSGGENFSMIKEGKIDKVTIPPEALELHKFRIDCHSPKWVDNNTLEYIRDHYTRIEVKKYLSWGPPELRWEMSSRTYRAVLDPDNKIIRLESAGKDQSSI